jgi:uncharacterized repeat protein (TIGR03803 family)
MQSGGANGAGTVFEIAKSGGGYSSTPIVPVSFYPPGGYEPQSTLIMDAAGDLFGVTHSGGANNAGTVFEIAKSGGGYSMPTVLASFVDAAGDLFGTALDIRRGQRRDSSLR